MAYDESGYRMFFSQLGEPFCSKCKFRFAGCFLDAEGIYGPGMISRAQIKGASCVVDPVPLNGSVHTDEFKKLFRERTGCNI